jgi:neutral ceramidase
MVQNIPSPAGPHVPDLLSVQIEMMPEPHADRVPVGKKFGDVIEDVNPSYTTGSTVSVKFHAANPRHNQHIQGTFLTVERQDSDMNFSVIATDGDWETKFFWLSGKDDKFDFGFSHLSTATLSWEIPSNTNGIYKICYHGDYKHQNTITPFTGCSSTFEVV